MAKLEQKTIEQYFNEFKITSEKAKERILLKITDVVYDRNRHVTQYEAEQDEYRKKQLETGINELEQKIVEIIKENK